MVMFVGDGRIPDPAQPAIFVHNAVLKRGRGFAFEDVLDLGGHRPAIFIVGLLGAFGAAFGLMLLLEMLDTRIRGRRQVVNLVGVPPLAIIPWVAEEEKPSRFRFWHRSPAAASAARA